MASTADTKKSRGRPRTGIGTPVMVRLSPELLAKVDAWAERHEITRPEAIRAMIEAVERLGGIEG